MNDIKKNSLLLKYMYSDFFNINTKKTLMQLHTVYVCYSNIICIQNIQTAIYIYTHTLAET